MISTNDTLQKNHRKYLLVVYLFQRMQTSFNQLLKACQKVSTHLNNHQPHKIYENA